MDTIRWIDPWKKFKNLQGQIPQFGLWGDSERLWVPRGRSAYSCSQSPGAAITPELLLLGSSDGENGVEIWIDLCNV
jgi:hypothetical protein